MQWLFGSSSSSAPPPSSSTPPSTSSHKLLEAHALARDCLSLALQADESGDSSLALKRYLQCLSACSLGLSPPGAPSSRPTVGAADAAVLDELAKWQASVADRIAMLKTQTHQLQQQPRPRPMKATHAPRKPAAMPTKLHAARTTNSAAAPPPTTQTDAIRDAVESMIVPASMAQQRMDDIKGLGTAKQALREAVILPSARPDLFTGIRAPHRGVLLFGPPGNGKTMLARALAAESNATFFSVSAASLTSKFVGEGEKLVRALFERARESGGPSVIFIDEADALLSARGANEHDAMRRLKTEFLVQFDGLSSTDQQIFVLAATNRPQDLDEAVRRRFPRRVHIPLPDGEARRHIFASLLKGVHTNLSRAEVEAIVARTRGYTASDLRAACVEASMAPLRQLSATDVEKIRPEKVRAVNARDFDAALNAVRPTLTDTQREVAEAEWRAAGFEVCR